MFVNVYFRVTDQWVTLWMSAALISTTFLSPQFLDIPCHVKLLKELFEQLAKEKTLKSIIWSQIASRKNHLIALVQCIMQAA